MRRIHVDADELAEQRTAVLPVAIRVEGASAIAEAQVQHAVRPELQPSPVVVFERLGNDQQSLLTVRVRDVRILAHLKA